MKFINTDGVSGEPIIQNINNDEMTPDGLVQIVHN